MVSRKTYDISNLTILRSNEPSYSLADEAQKIGYAAWSDRFSNRPKSQIENVFNANSIEKIEKLQKAFAKKIGRFVSVIAMQDTDPVGYAWGSDDVGNMSITNQKIKQAALKINGKKPYAWVAQINVLPEYQREGIGSAMLKELLTPFDDDQRVSTYVFHENQLTLGWFLDMGFDTIPNEPVDPSDNPDGPDYYFGTEAEHVLQWRLQASSVDDIVNKLGKIVLPEYKLVELGLKK